MKLSACIELLFTDRDFTSRIDAVAAEGLAAIEFWGWRDKDLKAIDEHVRGRGLVVANMNLDPLVCVWEDGGVEAFTRGVRESCAVARQLGCERLATPVDRVNWGPGEPWYNHLTDERLRAEWRASWACVVRALKAAASIAEGEGITLLLEPLNTTVDHRGYFLSTSTDAFELVGEVGSSALRVLFDTYHQQLTEGNLIGNLIGHLNLVGHVHVADAPGRHEPGTGEINFANVFRALMSAGYAGYIGLEYSAAADTVASLRAVKQLLPPVNEGQA